MKKIVSTILFLIIFPIQVLAYSKYIIPGGDTIGIEINTDGLIVVGFYKVDNKYIAKPNIKIGDRIIKINNINVYSSKELDNIINDNIVDVELIRNSKIINTKLELKEENGIYKTGLYIKDSIIGLGTLTYIDPVTKKYGALGHEIILNETKDRVEVRDGNILLSNITKINRSTNGYVGSKSANILYDNKIGTIKENTTSGIFGEYTSNIPNRDKLEIADYSNIIKDKAYILTVTENNNIEKYEIEILDKYNNRKDTQKAFSFKITDKKLLEKTGGIVQGMSGSPIIQNNKIIGAVTNVLIDDVKYGFGISIVTMLETSEK